MKKFWAIALVCVLACSCLSGCASGVDGIPQESQYLIQHEDGRDVGPVQNVRIGDSPTARVSKVMGPGDVGMILALLFVGVGCVCKWIQHTIAKRKDPLNQWTGKY